MLESLANHKYYCFLYGYSGFFHIPIHLDDQEKTTFACPYGTFAYHRMPFGLCNAHATFQSCMIEILWMSLWVIYRCMDSILHHALTTYAKF